MERAGSGAPQARHRTQGPWAAINLTGTTPTKSRANPQAIINPGLHRMHVRWANYFSSTHTDNAASSMADLPGILEMSPDKGSSNKDRPTQDRPPPLPPHQTNENWSGDLCWGLNIFPGGAGPGWWLHPLSLWHCCPVAEPATSWSPIFRRG